MIDDAKPGMTVEEIRRHARNLIWNGRNGLEPRDLWGDDDA